MTPRFSSLTLPRLLITLTGGLLLFGIILLGVVTGYRLLYLGRIFPGVSMAGVDLSGLRPSEAGARLNQVVTFPIGGRIVFRDGERVWVAAPFELGLTFDAASSAGTAFRVGRQGGAGSSLAAMWRAARHGLALQPVILYDQRIARSYLESLARQIDRPTVEASLTLQGTEVTAQPGQVGRRLDIDATLAALTPVLTRFHDAEVSLIIHEQPPLLLDVSAQAESARRLLSQPFLLVMPDPQPGDPPAWSLDPQALASMLQVVRSADGTQLEVALSPSALVPVLTAAAEQVDRPAENARFIFNDDTRQLDLLRSAVIGRRLDIPATLTAVDAAVRAGAHQAELVVVIEPPAVTDAATAADLGITELIQARTTYFYGSSAARKQNIRLAAAAFHGLLVPPGATFSMGEALGDISLDSGYAEAMIIYEGRTIKGVGGGVCQVSTTLFRTVFFAGFPVLERHAHAYRVYYYEQEAGNRINPKWAGLDATVYFPLIDFVFQNDSPYWLLMETYVYSNSIEWKFYSTSDGRTVEWSTTGPVNVVPAPPPKFEMNPELEAGTMKQVDWQADGADVTVTRIVRRDGQILFQDRFVTHYEPWQAVCQFSADIELYEDLARQLGICQP